MYFITIYDSRELTSNMLRYYKGDTRDELPGLVDFTVERAKMNV